MSLVSSWPELHGVRAELAGDGMFALLDLCVSHVAAYCLDCVFSMLQHAATYACVCDVINQCD